MSTYIKLISYLQSMGYVLFIVMVAIMFTGLVVIVSNMPAHQGCIHTSKIGGWHPDFKTDPPVPRSAPHAPRQFKMSLEGINT